MSKTKEFNKKVFTIKLVLILVVGIILGVSCIFSKQLENLLGIGDKEGNFVSSELIQDSKLSVHYIDVGQGDSTFISLPDGKTMMIDAGTANSGEHIVNYLNNLGIKTIDYFILTHSDSDHVGGASKVFENFEIKTIYRPFQISVNKDSETPSANEDLGIYATAIYPDACNLVDTTVYRNFITAIYSETYVENGITKNAEVWVTYDGIVINSTMEGEEFTFEFFAPLVRSGAAEITTESTKGYPTQFYGKSSSESKNNSSPVMLLEYNEKSFMFTGDAAFAVEEDFLASLETSEKARFDNVSVFQAGHHGSNTSNSQELLELITPTYVVVSCGKDNSYGHPGTEFVSRLDSLPHSVNDYLLVTADIGNIVFGFQNDGTLSYTALKEGVAGVTIYWWQIAIGAFVVISVIILSVKVTTNKTATAKRVVSTTKRVTKKFKNN